METYISNAFDIDANETEDDGDSLTSLQILRMNETRKTCPRCKQGFCATHGTKLSAYKDRAPWAAITQLPEEEETETETETETPQDEGLDQETNPGERATRICKNVGCGKKFTEDQNHSNACHYHRGPIYFGKKSTDEHKWICCDVPVPNFDELETVPPCTPGKHYAPPP